MDAKKPYRRAGEQEFKMPPDLLVSCSRDYRGDGASGDQLAGPHGKTNMSFLYPAFLVGALAMAVPIVLHLLRRDVAPDVPFSAVRLLQKSPVEQSRRRQLKDLLLLAARVAALLLLALAFARPYRAGAVPGACAHRRARSFLQHGRRGTVRTARATGAAAIDEAARGERSR